MSEPTEPTAESAPVSKRNRKIVAVVALGAILGAAYFLWPKDEESKREAALQTCRSGNFTEAEPMLKDVLAHRPDDEEVLHCLARGYLDLEKFADAEPYLTKLIDLQPQNADYLRERMEAYRHLKLKEKAYANARQLLTLDPTDVRIRQSTMTLAFAIGQFAEAEEQCRLLLKDKPESRQLRMLLAHIREARGDDKSAGAILDELIREDANDYGALLAHGILYDETGHTDRAIPLLRRVYEDDRSRRRTSGYQLGMALAKVGQKAEAERVNE